MTKAIAKTYGMVDGYRLQLAYALIAVCFFLLISYVSNVYSVITRSVAIEKTQSEMSQVSGRVKDLDQKYLEATSKITPSLLAQYGLKEGKEASFISRTASLGSVATRGNEL